MPISFDDILIRAAVMDDAGALAEDPVERVQLSRREVIETIAKLSPEDRRRALRRGKEILQWSE